MIKTNIGIVDADLLDNGTRHPNLALMKISGSMKAKGYNVELLQDYNNINDYNKIYLSKVFTTTNIPININEYSNIEYGGTGFFLEKAPNLPDEIEHHMPDYHLYDDFVTKEINRGIKKAQFLDYMDYSIGFSTRGCFRKCPFCVNIKYNKVSKHSPISEFVDPKRKYIYLWDDNFLGYERWNEILDELEEVGKSFQFRQGLDIRVMSEEQAKRLCKVKYKGDFIFAFDSIEYTEEIKTKLRLWKKHYTKKGNTKLYVLCAFDKKGKYDLSFWKQDIVNTLERIKILMEHGCIPYIMRYPKYIESPYQGIYTTLARWCNQPSFFKKESLKQYVYITDGIGREHKTYASKRYIEDFTKEFPEIATKYFDLRFEDLNQYK